MKEKEYLNHHSRLKDYDQFSKGRNDYERDEYYFEGKFYATNGAGLPSPPAVIWQGTCCSIVSFQCIIYRYLVFVHSAIVLSLLQITASIYTFDIVTTSDLM